MSYHYLQLAIVLAFYGQCCVYAQGYGQPCGEIKDVTGTCDAGLQCSNTDGTKNQLPGVCCRTSPPAVIAEILPKCPHIVTNRCSLLKECAKGENQPCGGPGFIYGTCEPGLLCYELTAEDGSSLVAPMKSTCYSPMIIT